MDYAVLGACILTLNGLSRTNNDPALNGAEDYPARDLAGPEVNLHQTVVNPPIPILAVSSRLEHLLHLI